MTGKTRKKLSFTHFFLKRFIPLLIAGVVLCAIGTVIISNMFWATNESMCSFEFANVKATILEDSINGLPDTLIKYRMAIYSDYIIDDSMGTQKAMVITDAETGEIVTDSGFALYAFHRNEGDEKTSIYICEDKAVLDFYMEYNGMNVMFDINDIYVQEDGSFLPGAVTVTELDGKGLSTELGILGEKDFTPADKDNYTHYGDRVISIAVGTLHDNENLRLLTETVKSNPGIEGYTALNELYQTEKNVLHTQYDTFKYNGREYALYSYATYDMWASLGGFFLIDYTVLLVIILAVSLIWAKLAHTRYSAKFDSDEMRRNMVDALAHDLKSPLTAISGYAENLANGTHPEKNEHYTTAIIENVEYMNSIISSTLALSKVENCTALRKEQVDVTALTNELFEKYRPQAEEKGITYTSEGSCVVSADRALISQVMENLITNAVKYTPDGGSITVSSKAKSISVVNTCNNTANLQSQDLTAPFAKGSESRSDRTGSGMGLAIAKSACQRQSCTMKIKCEQDSFTATVKF